VAAPSSPQRLPSEFRDLLDPGRAFTVLALELADGTQAPRVVVATDGTLAGLDSRERGPGGTPPPIDIREDEIVAARRAGGLAGAVGLGRWRRRELARQPRLRIRAWSTDPGDRFAHLRPVIRFMQLKGNKLVHDLAPTDKGVRAVFVDPLDLESLQIEYELPSSLALRPQFDAIACRNTHAEILGARGIKR
jgi:hypothetical protein